MIRRTLAGLLLLVVSGTSGQRLLAQEADRPSTAGNQEPAPGYAKKLDAYGIRIEATDLVRNDWLYFSALTYEHMTDHETPYDIREALADRGFRILLAETLKILPSVRSLA